MTYWCTRCLSSHPTIARGQTDATRYFLHSELRKERDEIFREYTERDKRFREYTERKSERARRDKVLLKAKVAHVALKTGRPL